MRKSLTFVVSKEGGGMQEPQGATATSLVIRLVELFAQSLVPFLRQLFLLGEVIISIFDSLAVFLVTLGILSSAKSTGSLILSRLPDT
jgi:hypothetical protein